MLYFLICLDTIPLNIPKDTTPIIPVPEEKYVPSESKEVIANVSKEDNDKPREKKSVSPKKVSDRKEEKIRKLMKKYYKKKIQRLDTKDLGDLVKSFNKIEKTSKSRKKASSERKVVMVEHEDNEMKDDDAHDDDAHAINKKQYSSSPKRLVKIIDSDKDNLDDEEMKVTASTSKNKSYSEPKSNFNQEDLGHTCHIDMSKICPKCYRFRFTTTRAFVNYNPDHTYTLSLNLDISSEPFQVLRENRAKLKLFPTRLAGNDFRILNNFVNIDNDKKVSVTVYSPHSRK